MLIPRGPAGVRHVPASCERPGMANHWCEAQTDLISKSLNYMTPTGRQNWWDQHQQTRPTLAHFGYVLLLVDPWVNKITKWTGYFRIQLYPIVVSWTGFSKEHPFDSLEKDRFGDRCPMPQKVGITDLTYASLFFGNGENESWRLPGSQDISGYPRWYPCHLSCKSSTISRHLYATKCQSTWAVRAVGNPGMKQPRLPPILAGPYEAMKQELKPLIVWTIVSYE